LSIVGRFLISELRLDTGGAAFGVMLGGGIGLCRLMVGYPTDYSRGRAYHRRVRHRPDAPLAPVLLWRFEHHHCILQRRPAAPEFEISIYTDRGTLVVREYFDDDRPAAEFAITAMQAAD
jgi:hypothetical protein